MSERLRDLPWAVGSDHAGFVLKAHVKRLLDVRHIAVEDVGTHNEASTDYPEYAHAVARGIAEGRFGMAVLVCGTGLGMAMAANRHAGVRAAPCSDPYTAKMARLHNDANVLCVGARVVGTGVVEDILDAFLLTEFEGGRHVQRVEKIEPPASEP